MLLTKAFGLEFTQSEVDFVIPRLDRDLPLCIDPFLLYKSRDETLRHLHDQLLTLFNNAVCLFREGKRKEMDEVIDFPEVSEIGFGYSEGGSRGSGLGAYLNTLLGDTLAASEPLQERGLRHVEELQLLSMGIAADRVSDIAANVLKKFLIDYTHKQADLWGIPLSAAIPVNHYFDFEDYAWRDGYFDLPQNTITGSPILLVPRRMVRLLPWINLDDYATSDFRLFLSSSNKSGWSRFAGQPRPRQGRPDKKDVVTTTQGNLRLLDRYVQRKEKEAHKALPVFVDREDLGLPTRPMAEEFIQRLSNMPTGIEPAKDYQRTTYEIINYLFEPELTDGEMEVRTIDGTERRDIIYTNESDCSYWQYVRLNYGSPFIMFETKNVKELTFEHINQTANYLGARIGMLGLIVTRNRPPQNVIRKTFSIYNDTSSMPRKTVLILADEDLAAMLRNKDSGQQPTPTQYVQRKYRDFRTAVQ